MTVSDLQSFTCHLPRTRSFHPRRTRRGLFLGAIIGFAAVFTGCQTTEPRPDASATVPAPAAEPAVAETPRPADPVVTLHEQYTNVALEEPYVALTFDDGPSTRQTPKLLDILKERNIPATFFVLGERVSGNTGLLARMVEEGHEIGNHSWDHSRFDGLSSNSIRQQVEWTNAVIHAATGQVPGLVRPPYGAADSETNRKLSEHHQMKVIMWSVDSLDWKHRDPDRVRDEILSTVHPGAIILTHDIHPSTIAAMPATLDALLAEGYRFVTVSDLIEMEGAQ